MYMRMENGKNKQNNNWKQKNEFYFLVSFAPLGRSTLNLIPISAGRVY